MSTAFIIKTALELVAVLLLIVGFANEKKVVAFETALIRAVKHRIMLRRTAKQRAHRAEAEKAARRRILLQAITEPPIQGEPVQTHRSSKRSGRRVA